MISYMQRIYKLCVYSCIMKCRICNHSDLKEFLSLGKSPLANSFLSKENLEKEEPEYPLELTFCTDCKLVQLTYVVSPELMFRNYLYVSSTSDTFKIHFTNMAEKISKDFNLNEKSLAVDIGSNDGLLLNGFKKCGLKTIGVEPATNLAKLAEQNGVETINDFFNGSTVKNIIENKGHADVVTANNVFAHVDNILEFTKNVGSLLKRDGIFVVEVQYLVDMINKMTFDNIYHEHLSYFTLTSLSTFFKRHDMEVFDAQRVDSHGGSLRVFIKKSEGKFDVNPAVNQILMHEKKIGVEDFKLYQKFADKVYGVKQKLTDKIGAIKIEGKKIAGYGAPAKSTTLLNFCRIGKDHLDYIIDENKLKQGLFSPGTHIQIVGPKILDIKKPDYILILAWNFAEEILKKTKKYADSNVKFIIPLPEPLII